MLTSPSKAILKLEVRTWLSAGMKENAIRDEFGLTPTVYYQELNALLDDPDAIAYMPLTVYRPLRIRGQGTRPRPTRP